MKEKLKDLRKKFLVYGSLLAMTTTSLTGCTTNKATQTVEEYLQSDDSFDLLQDSSKLVIKTKKVDDTEKYYFAEKISLYELNKDKDKYINVDEFDKYFVAEYADTSKTYLYFDVFTGDLITVKYINKKTSLFKDDVITTKYAISDIIDEEMAYNYANTYIGSQDTYTRDEIQAMINQINDNSYSYVKTNVN